VSPVVQALPSLQATVLFVNTQPVDVLQVSVVHTLLSLHTVAPPGWQVPPPQVSPVVQALPSLHGAALFVNTQPVEVLQESFVHPLPSLHTVAPPGWQLPPPQVSPVVQALPSLHGIVLFVRTQPVAVLHVSVVHGFPSSQLGAWPPTHVPPAQVSAVVQALLSSHEAVLFVNTQPVEVLQVSVVHTSLSLHTVAPPG